MSKRFRLDKEDGIKILTGFGIAALGAVLTYGTEIIAQIDFGMYAPIVVALWSVIVNIGRKFISDNSK